MFQLNHVDIALKKDGRKIVEGFHLTINPGDKVALIGEEGNGKSTLLQWIADPDRVESYADCKGIRRISGTVGFFSQENDIPGETRVSDFLKGIDLYGGLPIPLWKIHGDMELWTSERPFSVLSGGEKVKVRLVRLLAEHPDLFLLDEPTNDLDLETLIWLEAFVREIPQPVLYVSHDETLLENTANVIVHLEQIKKKHECRCTVERMGYREYVEARLGRLNKQEQIARKQRADYENQQARWRQIYSKVEHQQETITRANPGGGRLLKKKIHALKSQEKRVERQKEDFEEIPSVEEAIQLTFGNCPPAPRGKRILDWEQSFLEAGGRILAQNLSLHVTAGERVAIVGDNGAGKTTCLRRLWTMLASNPSLHAGYMPQDYAEVLDYGRTPVDFLAPDGEKSAVTRARSGLGNMRFKPEEMEQKIGDLSGGQKAKLLLLHLMLNGSQVLVLDEPTRNLSPLSNPVIRGALAAFPGTILCVSHDRKFLREVCTTVYRLSEKGLTPYRLPEDG